MFLLIHLFTTFLGVSAAVYHRLGDVNHWNQQQFQNQHYLKKNRNLFFPHFERLKSLEEDISGEADFSVDSIFTSFRRSFGFLEPEKLKKGLPGTGPPAPPPPAQSPLPPHQSSAGSNGV